MTRIEALAAHLGIDPEDIDELDQDGHYGVGSIMDTQGETWAVLTDAEADEAWDAALDSYLDDCVLCELNGSLAHYFDREAWKRDARMDGRGHAISHYDGCEYYEGRFVLVRLN